LSANFDYYSPRHTFPDRIYRQKKDSYRNEEIERLFRCRPKFSVVAQGCDRGRELSHVSTVWVLLETMRKCPAKCTEDSRSLVSCSWPSWSICYTERNDDRSVARKIPSPRGCGWCVEVYPATWTRRRFAWNLGDEVDRITPVGDPLTGLCHQRPDRFHLFPSANSSSHPTRRCAARFKTFASSWVSALPGLNGTKQIWKRSVIKDRTEFDIEIDAGKEWDFCQRDRKLFTPLCGTGRLVHGLLYVTRVFSRDLLLVVDESHATIPQIGRDVDGDRSRKKCLDRIWNFGFPAAGSSAAKISGIHGKRTGQILYISATRPNLKSKQSGWQSELYPSFCARNRPAETEPGLLRC